MPVCCSCQGTGVTGWDTLTHSSLGKSKGVQTEPVTPETEAGDSPEDFLWVKLTSCAFLAEILGILDMCQWQSQDPNMKLLYHIRPYSPGIFPYIGLLFMVGTSNSRVRDCHASRIDAPCSTQFYTHIVGSKYVQTILNHFKYLVGGLELLFFYIFPYAGNHHPT